MLYLVEKGMTVNGNTVTAHNISRATYISGWVTDVTYKDTKPE